jgi:hypothetical protein
MTIKAANECGNCGIMIDQPGLCSKCLKRHDRILKLVIAVIWVLALISFRYYYVIFIAN